MKKIMNWVLGTTLLCGPTVLISCKEANTNYPVSTKVESTELIRTSQSWDGVELPRKRKQ